MMLLTALWKILILLKENSFYNLKGEDEAMEERYQQEAEFGDEALFTEDEPVEDEVVLDEVPEEEEGEEYEEGSEDSESETPEIQQRDKAQVRINRLTKERYKAENKAKKALLEADHWRQKYELSSQYSLRQYDVNASARLEKARAAHIAATESGDAEGQADANIEISAANLELQEIRKEKMRSEYEEKIKQQYPAQQQEEIDPEIIHDWVQENNDWINPQSKNYDSGLRQYIEAIGLQIENELRAKNQTHLIGTSEYIEVLDNHKSFFLNQRNQAAQTGQNTNQNRGLNMRQARGGAAPVRGAGQTQYRNNKSMDLTPAERAMVESISHTGVTEETFKKAKMADMKRREAERGGV